MKKNKVVIKQSIEKKPTLFHRKINLYYADTECDAIKIFCDIFLSLLTYIFAVILATIHRVLNPNYEAQVNRIKRSSRPPYNRKSCRKKYLNLYR